MNELSSWLGLLRKEAKLSPAALAEKTKIMANYLEALEKGDFAALPSLVHARAFALAFARACGADEDEAMERVSAAMPSKVARAEAAPPPLPKSAARFARSPAPAPAAPSAMEAAAEAAPEAAEPSSPLPWKLWSLVAAAAIVFLMILHGAVSWVRASKAQAPQPGPQAAAEASAQPESPTAALIGDELALRSRRPCWVLLVIDGKRLPVVFLEPDKRERWSVFSKAVMLSGNIGAVRVWWRGDNLGYFGELGERMNGIVFETGKPWRKDPSEDLALPPGVPSKAPK